MRTMWSGWKLWKKLVSRRTWSCGSFVKLPFPRSGMDFHAYQCSILKPRTQLTEGLHRSRLCHWLHPWLITWFWGNAWVKPKWPQSKVITHDISIRRTTYIQHISCIRYMNMDELQMSSWSYSDHHVGRIKVVSLSLSAGWWISKMTKYESSTLNLCRRPPISPWQKL